MSMSEEPSREIVTFGKNELIWQSLLQDNTSMLTADDVHESWLCNNFNFVEESDNIAGLRSPQIGGIYAALAHIRSDERSTATVVMPTGTGKTETILSMVVAGKFKRTLVIVPSDALRKQTVEKFVSLGLLRELGLVTNLVLNPKVMAVKQGMADSKEIDSFKDANVIIATASSLANYSNDDIKSLSNLCSHLIVDEAHHVVASTWNRVKEIFKGKPIFQFTATPFRSDKNRVDGKIIFNYPIKQAQKDGYFKAIEFHPIKEFVDEFSDKKIAEKAVSLLRKDRENGLNHILMARVSTIERSKKVFQHYENHTDLNPIVINSQTKNKKEILDDIKNLKHSIIVCVDMLGEGFDLPQLKVSALHDIHKSINIMLQFTGRFTRKFTGLGNAKFVANIADTKVNDTLEELYSEDSDWNDIIQKIGTKKVSSEKEYQEFRQNFDSKGSNLLEQGISPKISTQVFRVANSKWKPDRFIKFQDKNHEITDSTISKNKDTLIFSVKTMLSVPWSNSQQINDVSWDLYIVFYDKKTNLVYVHSSSTDGNVKRLVELVAKDSVKLTGENMFRVLGRVKRLRFQNIGLNKDKSDLRFIMYTGTNTKEAIPELEAQRARKSNIFGKGYEEGKMVTIGCSHKGKVWAMDSDSIDVWIKWCKKIGSKILDETINTNEIMKTAMQSEELKTYPKIQAINIDWPEDILRKNESRIDLLINDNHHSIVNYQLEINKDNILGNNEFDFILKSDHETYKFKMSLNNEGKFIVSGSEKVKIKIGTKTQSLDSYFSDNPPIIFLSDTSIIEGTLRHYCEETFAFPYDIEKIEVWDWKGIDISVESQRDIKISNSIQYKTIQTIKDQYDIVFDDDGSGEVADIVAIKNTQDEQLIIDFYHCKYCSKGSLPGARVDDVYQVSGQAVKSVKWVNCEEKLFERLISREKKRLQQQKSSRIDKGTLDLLVKYKKMSKYCISKYSMYIVQPAISKIKTNNDVLSIIGSAENYIKETTGINLSVISSK
ncbi:DEAD/DEAH box helicase [Vibrio atlanticus]|uniref:DEAD/DEAH box helicase n=1 Tax=Vibrio atlanticus TaxID=693153 RepID=UPI003D1301C6